MARKILLADDSVTAQNMGRKILADAGYDVVTVNNGSAALKRIAEVKPDLIVLDVYMPGYSGLEVCQRLKDSAETEHIPVLLTVGKLEPFKPEEARRVRADAHIIKPFEASELLTAITKLEDRMVPAQPDGSRFGGSVSGVERFAGDGKKSTETDTGWKNRLRFPSKKKKEEPEPEPDEVEAANFRDFRKGKSKSAANAPFTVKAPAPAGQEPGLVPDIPRDITPEELDALSALAAKLDGPIPAAENIAPLAEKMGPPAVPVTEVAAPSSPAEDAKTEVAVAAAEVTAAVASEGKKEEIAVKAPEAAPAAAVAEFAVVPTAAPESAAPAEIPVAEATPVDNLKAEETQAGESKVSEAKLEEVQKSETLVTVPVKAASLAEEAAPVDRTDEPAFASASQVVAQAEEIETSSKSEEKPAEAIAEQPATVVSATLAEEAVATASAEVKSESPSEAKQAQESKVAEFKAEEAKADEPKTEAPKPEDVASPAPVAAVEPEAQEPSPTDEELAEALRLLTPSAGHAEASTVPSHGTLVAAGQLLAEEVARNASSAPRWVAQPVQLSPGEAALSLEAEMRAFAATTATLSAASGEMKEPAAAVKGVSAIAAAVENRLASMEVAPPTKSSAEQVVPSADAASAESATGDRATTGNKVTPFVIASAQEAAQPQPVTPEKAEALGSEAEQKNDAAEEAAPVTFADAMSKDDIEATEQQSLPAQGQMSVEETEEQQDSSSEVGSQESMAKAKAGKSNWHQIHTAAPAAAAASGDAVEAAKQAEPAAAEAPKVMAAAASAEGSSAAPAPDAGTIASIVDSVMADLRPKIVEEIAKKLAGK